MNAILGMSKLLRDTPLNTKQQEYANIIRQSSENLLVIINDILDHSKIESGKYSFVHKSFELPILIRQLEQIFQHQAAEKGLQLNAHLQPDLPQIVIGDQVRLNQILINLLANAIKFTENGHIDLFVRRLQQNEQSIQLEFEVRDTGIGVAPDQQKKIFESFEQVNDNNLVIGTGLGLAITKNLVEQQGGQIRLQSKSGKGSSFFVQLQFGLGATTDLKEEQKQIDPAAWKALHILVVEDTPFNQVLAVELLKSKIPNVRVEVADNGQIAQEVLQEKNFDLILMDVKMPVMDGYEATERIRKNADRQTAQTPIIALTANVTVDHLAKCRKVGMNAVITKPINGRELLMKIQQVLNLQS